MKWFVAILVVVLMGLQYRAWFSDDGYFAARALNERLEQQQHRAELQRQRNRLLAAEVLGLKKGNAAVEARARADLGMIREGETFYVVAEDAAPKGSQEMSGTAPEHER